MTLFFSSRSSSSFVALNATAGCSVFVRIKNDAFADLRLLSLDEGINWFSFSQQKMTLFFSSRSSSSFVALNATAGCSVFVRMKNDVFADFRLLFPEVWMRCLCSPRMESTPKLLMSTCRPRSSLNWGRLRVRGNTILTPSQSSLNGCSLMSYPGHCWSTCWSLLAWASRSALPHRTYLQFCTHPQNQCLKEWWGISPVEVQFWMLLCGH